MKVLHITGGELSGGAARGVYTLHCALRDVGIESKILTNANKIITNDKNIITVSGSKWGKILSLIYRNLDQLCSIFYKKKKKFIFSTGFFGVDITKYKEFAEADIIHLHWINDGFVNIKCLKKITKPVVWTLRDMWPFTGGCHVGKILMCENYKSGCGHCKQLDSNKKNDLSKIIWNRKKKYLPKKMSIVGISHWITDLAKESLLFQNYNIKTIYNNINTNDFFPIDKKIARDILKITTNKIIISYCASTEMWKGALYLQDIIKNIDKNKYFFLFFGKFDYNFLSKFEFDYKDFGFLNDNISLQVLYNASDIFLSTSMLESFGKTLAEAQACGIPTVCFDSTGPRDIVEHKITGYRAIQYKSESLTDGIRYISSLSKDDYNMMCINSRKKVVSKFDANLIALKYKQLYYEIFKI